MSRLHLNALLLLLLVLCGLSLVTAQYRARGLFIDLEQVQGVARTLEVEWNQLLLEQTNYSRHSLIESAARNELRMQAATPARTEYLALPSAVVVDKVPAGGGP